MAVAPEAGEEAGEEVPEQGEAAAGSTLADRQAGAKQAATPARKRAPTAPSSAVALPALAEKVGKRFDLLRTDWLEAKVAAGLGRAAEAQAVFERVRQEFTAEEMAYDCALVSLDLALVLLAEGRTAEVRTLAEEMAWVFRSQGVHLEALAALQLFRDAALRAAATVELTRRVARFLHRAQLAPGLRFEETEGAEEGKDEA